MVNFKNILIVLISFLFFVSCGDPIPIQEMSKAKKEISRAYSVKAEKYAKEDIDSANENLKNSHDSITDEKMDDAKDLAETSYEFAKKAYDKSVILLAKDTIALAEESLNLANEAYAEEFSKNEYKKASDLIKKSNKTFEEEKYYNSYEIAVQADIIAKNARNIALSKESVLFDEISEVNEIIKKTQNYEYQRFAPEKIKLATENLDIAVESHKKLKLKKGFAAVEIAKLNAEEAYLSSLEGTAKLDYVNAELVVVKASETEGASIAKDELAAANEALGSSKKSLDEKQYLESIAFSNEAYRLATIVKVTNKPQIETKIEVAQKKPKKEQSFFYYKVKYKENYKDCLWRISKKYYKNPRLWKKIYKANKKRIKNPDIILPGWIIKIPKK